MSFEIVEGWRVTTGIPMICIPSLADRCAMQCATSVASLWRVLAECSGRGHHGGALRKTDRSRLRGASRLRRTERVTAADRDAYHWCTDGLADAAIRQWCGGGIPQVIAMFHAPGNAGVRLRNIRVLNRKIMSCSRHS